MAQLKSIIGGKPGRPGDPLRGIPPRLPQPPKPPQAQSPPQSVGTKGTKKVKPTVADGDDDEA